MKPYYEDKYVTIYNGDCREILPQLPKVDLVLTDPPYGITQNNWDSALPMVVLWNLLIPLCRINTPIVMTAAQPFASQLIVSNLSSFKYDWVWDKCRPTGFLNAKKQPLRQHESVLVFYNKQCTFNPQMHKDKLSRDFRGRLKSPHTPNYGKQKDYIPTLDPELSFPRSLLSITTLVGNAADKLEHPTQKPEKLFSYLIQTYTNTNDIIIDPFLGSGTTCYCAKKLLRKSIGIEIEEKYCEIAAKRCSQMVMEF